LVDLKIGGPVWCPLEGQKNLPIGMLFEVLK